VTGPVGELSQRIAALSPEQRALLAARLQAGGIGALEPAKIPRRRQAGPVPLSFAQQRLWFLQQLEPASAAYNIPVAYRLKGVLDVVALERALEALVGRHEVLRTTFADAEDAPVQVVAPTARVTLPVVDLSASRDPEREARRAAAAEARAAFDLERGPVLRCKLLRLAPCDHVLVLTVHHIASDGWSMGVLLRELGALYREAVTGAASSLRELPVQYPDYAVWQREQFRRDRLGLQLDYWKHRLAGAPTILELPTDRPRPAVASGRSTKATIVLPAALARDLEALSRGEGATLFMTLLAAFKLLLARYSGQTDIVVGTPVAGRSHTELESLIGCFLNTLVLRTDLAGGPTFRELLGRVRETAVGAYAHQDLPFERLVEELQPARSLGHNPLFQVMFQAGNTPGGSLKLEGLEVSRARTGGGVGSKFYLSLRVRQRPDGLACICAANADLYDAETLSHLLEQFGMLLQQVVAQPDASIESYSLVTERARAMLPDPGAPLEEPRYPPLLATIRRTAAARESRTAIEQAGRCWTYGDLMARVDALTGQLAAVGVAPGEVVAVSGRSSFGLVAAMLAVIARGAVLLPISPDLPDQRKRLMLHEAGGRLVLQVGTPERPWAADLPQGRVVQLTPTGEPEGAAVAPVAIQDHSPAPNDPAYVFFTSGTTGTPKAVLGVHKGISHFLAWQSRTFAAGPADRCAQLTNISFDVVLRDILMPLWSGATLCLPPADLPPERVIPWLADERITLVHTVPSLSQAWLIAAPERSVPALRWVFSAGEPLTDALVRQWRRVASPRCGIVNLYGPTETTMVKCWYHVPDEVLPGVQPVGESLPDSEVLVLSAGNRVCGVNEVGEIVLRTPFRTRGYLNAAEAQQRQFVVNPFRDDADDLLYRTGDLGRRRPDGSLMVLARLDQQVKIRGVRIEPEEVTAVLARHERVSACAVVARAGEGGEPFLVAYVVARDGGATAGELRAFLAEHLPAALVPSAFVRLERMPLTPNGKLDRRALPSPEAADAAAPRPYVAPRTPIERLLAGIWAEVLGVPRVGVDDDFFELGGHSLGATRIIARARTALGAELPLRSFFETPTVAGLSLAIARQMMADAGGAA
jgi:amino acid adenylation domain-containing protein